MKKCVLMCLFMLVGAIISAQNNKNETFTLSGTVIDAASRQPLEYATIVLKNIETENISGGITDTKGNFSIDAQKGIYNISVEYISFKTVTFNNQNIDKSISLGTIELSEDLSQLDEVVVVAEKTTVDIRLDKKIYNIGKDLSVRGGTASDVLGNVPSVQVDVEGAVSLRGSDNVTILIDGRPSALVGLNGADALRQIPANAIEKVEVITSPSARYDAEGTAGILNIILRKNKLRGFNGSVQLDAGVPERYGLALNANLRSNQWNFFTNTGWRYRATPGNAFNDSRFFSTTAANARTIEDRRFNRLGRTLFSSIGAQYNVNDNSSITANVVYNYGNDDDVNTNDINRFDINGSLNESTLRTENESEDESRIQYTLDYANNFDGEGKKLTVNAQYSTEIEDIFNSITEFDVTIDELNDLETVIEEQNEDRGLLQIDFVNPINETTQFELGYRGNYRDIFNSFFLAERLQFPNGPLVPDTGLNNAFSYEEFVNAAYAQYGKQFKKLSILAGLRYEHTAITIAQQASTSNDKKDYGNLFPTINIGYELNDDQSFTLGYNRRIRRPRGRFLNPFPSRSSESNIFSGNVDLNPVITDAFDLGYLKKWEKVTLSTSVYFNTSQDNWEFIQEDTGQITDNGDPVIRRFPINLSTQQRLGYEFTLNYKPYKFWNINSDFNLFHVTTDGSYTNPNTNEVLNFDFDNTAFFLRLNQKFSLPSKIDLQINSNYRGPNRNAQTQREGIFSMNIAASKDLFKDKATINLSISDVFNSRVRRQEVVNPGVFAQYSEFQWRERQLILSFIYRFNQKKKSNRGGSRGFDGGDFEG